MCSHILSTPLTGKQRSGMSSVSESSADRAESRTESGSSAPQVDECKKGGEAVGSAESSLATSDGSVASIASATAMGDALSSYSLRNSLQSTQTGVPDLVGVTHLEASELVPLHHRKEHTATRPPDANDVDVRHPFCGRSSHIRVVDGWTTGTFHCRGRPCDLSHKLPRLCVLYSSFRVILLRKED